MSFSLPPPQKPKSQNPRKITSHCLLTSQDIISMKREKAEQKLKTEALKQARKEARKMKAEKK